MSSRMRKTGKTSTKRHVTGRKTSRPRRHRKGTAAVPSGAAPAPRPEPPPIIPQPTLDLEEEEEEFPTDEGEQRQEPPPPSASWMASPRGDDDDLFEYVY